MGGVVVRRFDVPVAGWPPRLDGLRIAHISDLHLRRWTRRLEQAQALLLHLDYDLLAVTGDFCDEPADWPRGLELARRFFEPIHAKAGSFAVLGNHDHPALAAQDGLNLCFLRDRHELAEWRGTPVPIAGVEQTDQNLGNLAAALDAADETPAILLAHYPSTVFEAVGTRAGLVLAGHTHGGQLRLPLLGCMWTNDNIPLRMARGLHQVDHLPVHVTAGLGTAGPICLRFCCPPEIAVLTLRAAPSRLNRLPAVGPITGVAA